MMLRLILRLDQAEPLPQDSAVQARILADQAVQIVRQYGPAAVLQATADALTYYATDVQAGEPMSTTPAYDTTADAIQACRQAVHALRLESAEMLSRF